MEWGGVIWENMLFSQLNITFSSDYTDWGLGFRMLSHWVDNGGFCKTPYALSCLRNKNALHVDVEVTQLAEMRYYRSWLTKYGGCVD
jgi:hypothetical protein